MHALDNHFTHPYECRRLFGSNWASKLVNGIFVEFYDQVITGNTRPSTFIVDKFIILGTQNTKDMNKISVRKSLAPLQFNTNAALAPMFSSTTQKKLTMVSRTEAIEQNIMAAESPGGALLAPPKNAVIDTPGIAVLSHPDVPEGADEYLLRTPTRGASTPPPGATQPATNAVAPVPVNLHANSPRSIPVRVTTAGGGRGTGERDAVVAEKHGKKWVKVTPK